MSQTNTEESSKLKRLIEQIERIEQEKVEIADHIKDIYDTARSEGFDVRIMRKIISMRKRSKKDLEEEEMLIDTYKNVLGM